MHYAHLIVEEHRRELIAAARAGRVRSRRGPRRRRSRARLRRLIGAVGAG
jgi:hypothetical protein